MTDSQLSTPVGPQPDSPASAVEPGPPVDPGSPVEPGSAVETRSQFSGVLREIATGNAVISVLAVVLALVAGGILIALTDPGVKAASGYFFSRPTDTLQAIWTSVSGAYVALFQG
jgi:hypothetical protein